MKYRKLLSAIMSLGIIMAIIMASFNAGAVEIKNNMPIENSTEITNAEPATESITEPATEPFTSPDLSGWKNIGSKWQYTDSQNNPYTNGFFTINGKKYLFDKNGYVLTGIQQWKNKIYFFSQSGNSPENGLGKLESFKGWKKINSADYYFNSDSSVAVNWKTIGKNTFLFSNRGKLKTGFVKNSGKTYYFKENGKAGIKGKLLTGLKTINKTKYYFNSKGVLQKNGIVGTKKIGYYYAKKSGKIDKTLRKAVTYKGKDWNVLNGKAKKVTSLADRTLNRALKVVEKVTTKKMSKQEKLKTCFEYAKNAYIEKNPRIPHYHGKNWPQIYANDMFVNGVGNCFSYGSAFAYMAKAIGYKNVYCCNSGGHGWAEINGKVYDPEWSRHHSENSYYALSYDKKIDQNYKGAIAPGYSWMHVKI